MVRGVVPYGELEPEVRFPRNPIGRPGTNENRVFWKDVFLGASMRETWMNRQTP
jgi:hypothetical protein